MLSDTSRIDEFSLYMTLNSGRSSTVKLARMDGVPGTLAMKLYHSNSDTALDTERSAYQTIPLSPHIVEFQGFGRFSTLHSVSGPSIESYLVLKEAEFGDLQGCLSRLGKFPLIVTRRITSDILAGLEKVHQSGWVHNDLKLENMLMNRRFGSRSRILATLSKVSHLLPLA